MREKLSSRLGFVLLSAGCAIGIGNVWRFPYVTGQSGGGWFVLLYLFFLAVLGVPVLVMEFAVGRAAQRSLAKAHETLTPARAAWRVHGIAGLLGIPACFAYKVSPDQGPGLIFVTLPRVFWHMPYGQIWGALFFLFMSFAALSTVLAVFESIIASIRDYTGWGRAATCALVGVGIAVLSVPCILGLIRRFS